MMKRAKEGFRKMFLIDPKHVTVKEQNDNETEQKSSDVQAMQSRLGALDEEMQQILEDRQLSDDAKLRRYLETLRRHIINTKTLDRLVQPSPVPVRIYEEEEIDKEPAYKRLKLEDANNYSKTTAKIERDQSPLKAIDQSAQDIFEDATDNKEDIDENEDEQEEEEQQQKLSSYNEANLIETIPSRKQKTATAILTRMNQKFSTDYMIYDSNDGTISIGPTRQQLEKIQNSNIQALLNHILKTRAAQNKPTPPGFVMFKTILYQDAKLKNDIEKTLKEFHQKHGRGVKLNWQRY
jgi:hypothetical protein